MKWSILISVAMLAAGASAQSRLTNNWRYNTPSPPAASSSASKSGSRSGTAPTVARSYVLDDKHKLAAGDRVSFQVIEDRDDPKPLVVTDSGELDIPYIGRIEAAKKTCKTVAEELKVLLEKDYYYRATVILGLDQINQVIGKVYVWGQVRTQGAIEVPATENFTAGKAILRAGGFADFANKKKVKLIRGGGKGGEDKQTFELNMVEILEEGKTEKDVTLQADDFIIVPSRLVNW